MVFYETELPQQTTAAVLPSRGHKLRSVMAVVRSYMGTSPYRHRDVDNRAEDGESCHVDIDGLNSPDQKLPTDSTFL